jgi:predicted site-specific integrase-resolvase
MAELRAVIYARYSSSSQREESIEGQVKECTAYAERNGYSVIGTYVDRALSGTTDNRPQFQKMIDEGMMEIELLQRVKVATTAQECCSLITQFISKD